MSSHTAAAGDNQIKLLDRFEILLDNPEEVYFAGQEITGKVVIACSEPKQLNEVLFEVKGRARTYWTQSRKTCSANEAYFCEQFNTTYTHKLPKNDAKLGDMPTTTGEDGVQHRPKLSKSDTRHLGRTLPPGLHKIPFSYTLPKHLPSSFEGDFGFVRYTFRAICERPWDFDIVCFHAFTVIGIEDLNHEAEVLSLPLETRSTHPVSLFCMKMGTVTAELRVEKGGYTPGENMRINLRVQNGSRRSLRGLAIRLCQNVTYRSKTFAGAELQRTTRHVVQRVVASEKVRRNTEFSWLDRTVPVPSIPPKMVTKCKLIDISYCLELQCNSPKFSTSLPIVIGTIPLLPGVPGKVSNGIVNNMMKTAAATTTATAGTNSSGSATGKEVVQVTVTDETGKTVDNKDRHKGREEEGENGNGEEDRMDPETERLQKDAAKKRVRMPSSVLTELYPVLPSPYYKKVYSGPVPITDDKERKFHFGQNMFAPKYPFYE